MGLGWWLPSKILLGFGLFVLFAAVLFFFDGFSTELRGHLEPGEDLSRTVPDRLVPYAMAIANGRRFARARQPVTPAAYATTILLMWGQLCRAAPIPRRQTIALLVAYVGTMALVPAAAVVLRLGAS